MTLDIDTALGHPLFPDTQIRPVKKLGLSPARAEQYLVQDTRTEKYYVVSGVHAPWTGWEVLIFESDKDGDIVDWGDVAGGRGIDFMTAIQDLEEVLSDD